MDGEVVGRRTRDRTIVVGAGVVGVTTAEMLAHRGFDVTVLDAAAAPAELTSRANASQLCAPFAVALGGTRFLAGLPRNLLTPGSGFGLSPGTALLNSAWGLRFLFECLPARTRTNSAALLGLARRSERALARLLERHPLDFAQASSGKLWLASTAEELRHAEAGLGQRRALGFDIRAVDREECISLEPGLAGARHGFAGAIFSRESHIGNCRAFTTGLASRLQRAGVTFRFGLRVDAVELSGGRTTGVRTDDGTFPADIVVLANGLDAHRLLPRFPGRLPIAPVRGYSVTLPLGPRPPERSITDPARAVAFCRLGDRLRVTGGAEFAGRRSPDPRKIARIIEVAKSWLPDAAAYDASDNEAWCGLRPTTPTSLPMIGAAGAEGLYVNAGHGSLGWTLAAGSAEALAEAIAERQAAPVR